LKLKLKQFN